MASTTLSLGYFWIMTAGFAAISSCNGAKAGWRRGSRRHGARDGPAQAGKDTGLEVGIGLWHDDTTWTFYQPSRHWHGYGVWEKHLIPGAA